MSDKFQRVLSKIQRIFKAKSIVKCYLIISNSSIIFQNSRKIATRKTTFCVKNIVLDLQNRRHSHD